MKKLLTALCAILFVSQNCLAADLSSWAADSFNRMSAGGMLDTNIVGRSMTQNITREEFCTLAMNLYKNDKRVVLNEKDLNIFDDTNNTAVLEAYKVGIVGGKGERIFDPSSPVTRQEIAVMISRTLNLISNEYIQYEGQVEEYSQAFADSSQTAPWALSDMAAVCSYKIISGNDNNEALPLNYATREQAICMLDRVYGSFIANTAAHTIPRFKSFDKKLIRDGIIKASWVALTGAVEYNLILKPEGKDAVVIKLNSKACSIDDYYRELEGTECCTVILGAVKENGTEIFSKPLEIGTKQIEKADIKTETSAETAEIPDSSAESLPESESVSENTQTEEQHRAETAVSEASNTSENTSTIELPVLNEKEARVFPEGKYFETAEEAEKYIVEVEVPVWILNSDGTKSSSKKYIEVNQALADDVINIFTEIFNDPAQFPIKNAGGYCWRNSAAGKISQHSYGTCIDINWNENYYVKPDGTPITGSYWKPGEDPYSIPADSIVVNTFAKYGWLWGGNAWSEKYSKDYMHFTYLGK